VAERYDLVVVGGGILGVGVARDAALRGLRVALFEAGDLGGGTSSRTSGLIHGGIRYLENLRLALVREGLEERMALLRVAPHLVWPCPFLIPYYKGRGRPRWYLEAGLALYDYLAGAYRIGRPRSLSGAQVAELEPDLPQAGLEGASLYLDAQVDDARLCLETAMDAAALGVDLFPHHEVVEIARADSGLRVSAKDSIEPAADPLAAEASAVVNAAGPWADRVRRLAGIRRGAALRPSRGTHVVVPALTRKNALLLIAEQDGRVFFILPGAHGSLVGATEGEHRGQPEECHPTVSEVAYLFGEIRRRWPARAQSGLEVRRAFSAVRPLARAGGPLGRVSRADRLLCEHGLFTIAGGKYTTHRAIAERTLNRVLAWLGKSARPCTTRERPLPGAGAGSREQAMAQARAKALEMKNLGNADADRLGARYGGLMGGAAILVEQYPGVHEGAGARILEGEVVYSVRHELARRLDDVLLRRLGLWGDRQALRQAAVPVSLWMAKHLEWSRARTQQEVERLDRMFAVEDRVISSSLAQ
jgi:glycerol-3-phosphate dehydrogenase